MKHADPKSLVLTLPVEQMERLDRAVHSGEYPSREAAVLDALRLWDERADYASLDEGFIKQAYQAGLASGEPIAIDIETLVERFKAEKHGQA